MPNVVDVSVTFMKCVVTGKGELYADGEEFLTHRVAA